MAESDPEPDLRAGAPAAARVAGGPDPRDVAASVVRPCHLVRRVRAGLPFGAVNTSSLAAREIR